MNKLLVTAAQAADMLSIGRSTLWREVAAGRVPAPIKIGAATRWRVADLQQFIEHLADVQSPGARPHEARPTHP